MDRSHAELGYDVLLTVAAGVGIVSYMLGVLLEPIPAGVVSIVLVVIGAFTLVPREGRVPAGMIGLGATILAGIVVPRAVASVAVSNALGGNELALTLVVSGVVLLLAFALVRTTSFRRSVARTA